MDVYGLLLTEIWPYFQKNFFVFFILAGKSQVTAILALGDYLYVASTWGCIIVVDNTSMLPYATFRCHADVAPYIRTLLPLNEQEKKLQRQTEQVNDNHIDQSDGLVSIGMGYRNMLSQNMKMNSGKLLKETNTCLISWSTGYWEYLGDARISTGINT